MEKQRQILDTSRLKLKAENREKTSQIDQLIKQLSQQEQSHKDQIKEKESLLNKEAESAKAKTEEAKSQCELLEKQIASLKAESDLQIKMMKTDFKRKIKNIKSQLDEKEESSKNSASCFFSTKSSFIFEDFVGRGRDPGSSRDLVDKKEGPSKEEM